MHYFVSDAWKNNPDLLPFIIIPGEFIFPGTHLQ
jgi:hypothetical protein